MLNIKFILKNKNKIIKFLIYRNYKKLKYLNLIININKKISKYNKLLQLKLKIINKYSKDYYKFKNNNNINFIKKIKKEKKNIKKIIFVYKKKLNFFLLKIPNIINKLYLTKYKKYINSGVIIYKKKFKKKKKKYLSYLELSKKIEIFDLINASKISGKGFVIYTGFGLKLYKSLVNYLLFMNKKQGYKEYQLPLLVNELSIYGTGQLPDKVNQIYKIKNSKLYLIPTGEVPLINIFSNKILDINILPIKLQAFTYCFRKEAGSYGSKVKGLNRLHQFGKIEIIEIIDKNRSNIRLLNMLKYIKKILTTLKIDFRIKLIPCKKLNITSSITFDFEIYSLGQKKWLEISSLSNCLDYQSNNLNIFYKKKTNNKIYNCHTLNASCLSIPRLLICIIEKYQINNKNIKIPKILKNFY
ncbi:MAG: serine--tRNA ligase [Candidatus Shikimatogenerans sp. JK-2022]|nr:serine--tRNA ligase [Candidatus Shikimatogenerans bostrichidophilus]